MLDLTNLQNSSNSKEALIVSSNTNETLINSKTSFAGSGFGKLVMNNSESTIDNLIISSAKAVKIVLQNGSALTINSIENANSNSCIITTEIFVENGSTLSLKEPSIIQFINDEALVINNNIVVIVEAGGVINLPDVAYED